MTRRAARPWFRRLGVEAIAAVATLGAGGLYAAFFASPYAVRLLTLGGIYAVLVIGYQFIFGHAGALSLAQGSFFGLGAYVTGILGVAAGWGFAATFPASIAAPTLLALVIAAPVLRLQSHYFALATLGIGQVLLLGAMNWESVTGGANGLPGVPPIILFDRALPAGLPLLAFVWGVLACLGLIAWQAMRGPWGSAFLMLRENPLAAAAIGLDAGGMRLAAFLLSAAYAGAAGALYAHTLRIVSPEVLGFPIMLSCLAMTVVGGRTRVAGAILGALLLVALPEWLRFLQGSYLLAYGLVLLAVIVLAPEGAMGLLARLRTLLPDGADCRAAPRPAPPPSVVAEPPPARLEIRGLVKRFGGIEALAGIDLVLASGEILGLIGPNGSGKTTLLNLVSGVDRVDAGTIRMSGAPLDGLPSHAIVRRGIARSFQAGSLVAGMTALDTVVLARLAAAEALTFRQALGIGRRRHLERAEAEAVQLLDGLAIGGTMRQPCAALPHGARRRLEMARALATRPRFLLLDEPAAGLAEEESDDLARRLAGLAREGIGILLVEHDMAFLMPLADRIICLDHGRILAAGTPQEIARDPRVLEAYLGADFTPVGQGRGEGWAAAGLPC